MTDNEIFELIRVVNSSELTIDFRSIYEEAFPPDERREWSQITELLNNPDFRLEGIYIQKRLVGMISFWKLHGFEFIEHFAIQKNEQGKGYGSRTIQQIISERKTTIVLEVEESINETAQKRIAFYKQFNFHLCDLEYFQPPYSADKKKIRMRLMSYPDQIQNENFASIKAEIYSSVYGICE